MAKKLKAEDVVDDIELDPKKTDHRDWDVLVAVAKVLRARFDAEKSKELTSEATGDRGVERKTSMSEISNHGLPKESMVIKDQEENVQKHVIQKGRRRCSSAGFGEDYLSDGEEEWSNYNGKNKNKKKKKNKKSRGRSTTSQKGGTKEKEVRYPPPDMPIEFVNRILKMGGTDIMFVIQKVLTKSDCKKDQNRLFISILDAADFLKESEKELLDSKAKEVKQSIDVRLVQPNLEETNITLKQYNLQKANGRESQQYVLNNTWFDVVRKNGLAENIIIQIWSFRMDGRLGLAIVKLPEGQELVDVGKSTRTRGSNGGTSTASIGGTATDSPSVSPSSLDIVN